MHASGLDLDTDIANRPYSTLAYGVSITGGDPACRDACIGVSVLATYRREGATDDEQSQSSSTGPDVSGRTVIPEALPRTSR